MDTEWMIVDAIPADNSKETIPMNNPGPLSVDEASRLAVTATTADLEDWAHSAAVTGQVPLADLLAVLEMMRAASRPAQSAPHAAVALAS